MKRRDFLKVAGAAAAAAGAVAGLFGDWSNAAEPTSVNIRDFLESEDPEALALAQRVFDKCILDKLRPPVEPLRHTWV